MPFRKRGTFKGYSKKSRPFKPGNAKRATTLQSQLDALKKVVKKDHQTIAKNIDWSDWYLPDWTLPAEAYDVFNASSLISPSQLVSTRRVSNMNTMENDAILKSITISIFYLHGASQSYISNNFYLVRPKDNWEPFYSAVSYNKLRYNLDYTPMGPGNEPALNSDRFTILKKISFTSCPFITGADVKTDATKRIKWTIALNQKIMATPANTATSAQAWRTKTAGDFAHHDRLYLLWHCDSPSTTNWLTANPYARVGVTMTTCTL